MITEERIRAQLGNCLAEARFSRWEKYYQQGKVRDIYVLPDRRRILITTDRQSAFDHVLGTIPFKGQVLNAMANCWFRNTRDIVPNHVIAAPHPNVVVARELKILPVEVVVRAYLTGSTPTSAWMNYQKGMDPYDLNLPPGLAKNTRFETPVITPTTKAVGHDEPLSAAEVVKRGLVAPTVWERVQNIALALFQRGTVFSAHCGLILVDTKYEFGLSEDGEVVLADEVHTPDSSRYWEADSYKERHAQGQEPKSLDKEFLRLWLVEHGVSDTHLPQLDDDIRVQVALRYIKLCERITGWHITLKDDGGDPLSAIEYKIAPFMLKEA